MHNDNVQELISQGWKPHLLLEDTDQFDPLEQLHDPERLRIKKRTGVEYSRVDLGSNLWRNQSDSAVLKGAGAQAYVPQLGNAEESNHIP